MINIIVLTTALLAYLIGAIPTGYIIARLKGIKDIREHGSGNIGATNVSRMLGLRYFFLIFLLDAGKAFLFMQSIFLYFPTEYLYCFAIAVLFGNTRSIFLRGSGGKGVATLFGLLVALNMTAVLIVLSIWLMCMAILKTVGIASICAIISLPIYAYITTIDSSFIIFSCVVSLWVVWLHKNNIRAYCAA